MYINYYNHFSKILVSHWWRQQMRHSKVNFDQRWRHFFNDAKRLFTVSLHFVENHLIEHHLLKKRLLERFVARIYIW